MNHAKLVDMFKNGNMVIPIFFLQKRSEFHLSMEEFIFLLYLYNLGDHFLFNPNKIAEDLNLELSQVMNYIGVLTDKKYIQVEVMKNEKGLMEDVVLLDGFYQKLSLLVMDEMVQDDKKEDSSVFELIEKEFGRMLGPIEIEIIKAWLENHISEDIIKEAIKEAVFNGVSNLRYIDKILYEWGKAGIKTVEDVEKMRSKRNSKNENDAEIDMDIVDWNWFDEDE